MVKKCSKCKETKPREDFSAHKCHTDGLQSWCKDCVKKYGRPEGWYENHKEQCRFNARKRYLVNIEKQRERSRRRNIEEKEKHAERVKRWRATHKEQCLRASREWCKRNLEKVNAARMKRYNAKVKTEKEILNQNVSSYIRTSLKGRKQGQHWEDLVGFTVEQLKKHLEKKFKPGMTWENYGTNWHIDHKIPISVFNFEKPDDLDFRLCWSLKNLQPLDKIENSRKGAKIETPFQPSLKIAL